MSVEPVAQPTVPLTAESAAKDFKIWQVISASAAGTMIEWYDFYIFGSLARSSRACSFPRRTPPRATC